MLETKDGATKRYKKEKKILYSYSSVLLIFTLKANLIKALIQLNMETVFKY